MSLETRIRFSDQLAVKLSLADAGFISGDQQDRSPIGIKSESHSPFALRGTESQLLHIRMAGTIEGIDSRSSQLRPSFFGKLRHCQNLRLHICMQCVELRLKLVGHLGRPLHWYNMAYRSYVFKYITEAMTG